MVIPAIDFQGGAVVQLVQGERQALERRLDEMLELFRGFSVLQVIDLDAAKGEGDNRELVAHCLRSGFRVRVGGGVRSVEHATELLQCGAEQVIVASAAFRDDRPDFEFLERLQGLGRDRLIIAVDSRGDRVATHGWRHVMPITTLDAVASLSPYCGEFLFTYVDGEGLMQGIAMDRVRTVQAATRNRLTVAGGIASLEEIEELESLGINSVLGMAIYTGKIPLAELKRFSS